MSESRWIPVSERLPENMGRVFVAFSNNYSGMACFDGERWRSTVNDRTTLSGITHWQPILIPSPPGSQPEVGPSDTNRIATLRKYVDAGLADEIAGTTQASTERRILHRVRRRIAEMFDAAMTAAQPEGSEQ